MDIKIRPNAKQNAPVDGSGTIRDEWFGMLRNFPDRFMLGSDAQYGLVGANLDGAVEAMRRFLDQLPTEIAAQVGRQNAQRIFNLA